jgi:hypothetical protein
MVSVADVMTELSASDGVEGESNAHEVLPDNFAYSDETCRAVAEEMATTGVMNMLVVDRETGRVCGTIGRKSCFWGDGERWSESRNELYRSKFSPGEILASRALNEASEPLFYEDFESRNPSMQPHCCAQGHESCRSG